MVYVGTNTAGLNEFFLVMDFFFRRRQNVKKVFQMLYVRRIFFKFKKRDFSNIITVS